MVKTKKSTLLQVIEITLFLLTVLSGLFLHFGQPIYNFLSTVMLVGIVIYFHRQNFSLFGPSLFFLLVYLTSLLPIARLGFFFIIPLALYLGLMFLYKRLKEKSYFIKAGKPGRNTWGLGLIMVIVSSLTLYVWAQTTNPNLNDILAIMPKTGLGALLLIGAFFAITNSIVEESIYRGILYNSLKLFFDSRTIAIIIQAALFGLARWQGIPSGATGVAFAFVYGILLGVIRRRSRGLLAPIIVHVAADFTIFLILLGMVGKL